MYKSRSHLTNHAKALRNNPTDAERFLWQRLKSRQLEGVKFRRQEPIEGFIVDFVSFDKRIVIELDGGQHDLAALLYTGGTTGVSKGVMLTHGNLSANVQQLKAWTFDAVDGRFAHLHYLPVPETPEEAYPGLAGLITGDLIQNTLREVNGKTFYLCGPQAMYDFCIPELERLGVPRRKIRREIYGPPAQVTRSAHWPAEVAEDQAFTVKIKGGREIKASAGTPLAVSLERQGIWIESLCRSGECSRCRIKILSGRVFEPPGVPVRRSDRRHGYIHACVAYPLSDLEISI